MQLYENIRKYRKKLHMTQEELARLTNYTDRSSIAKIEKGLIDISQSKLEQFAKVLGVTPGELMGNTEATHSRASKGISIPILNTVVAGMPVDAYEDILGYEEISRELASTGDFFALKVKGDSMLPVLQEGDVLIVRKQSDVESGDIAIVLINGDTATVKKIQKHENGIMLVAFNQTVYSPHFYTNEEIESLPIVIAGKVVEMKRSF